MNITDIAEKASKAHASGRPNISLLRRLGIQPTVAIAFTMIDWILFGGELFSAMVSLPVSITVGVLLGLWAINRQYVVYGDSIRVSIIKGTILGFLTAIPSPLASFFTLLGGLLPVIDKITGNDKSSDPAPEESSPEIRNVTPPRQQNQDSDS